MTRFFLLFVGALAVSLWSVSCSDDASGSSASGNGTSGVGASANGGGIAQGGDEGGGGSGTGEGGGEAAPVLLGLHANPTGDAGMPPDAADELLAELTAIAAGVSVLSVDVRWDQVDERVDDLVGRLDDYVAQNVALSVNLLVVDGAAAHFPALIDPLDAETTKAALDQSINIIVGTLGPSLHSVLVGRRVDTYLEANAGDTDGLSTLLTSGVATLQGWAVPTGVGLSFVGPETKSSYQLLLELGDVAALSYLPGLGDPVFLPDASAAKRSRRDDELGGGAAGLPAAGRLPQRRTGS